MNTLSKTWIGKKCKLVVEGLNKEQFYYTALILDINGKLLTIQDKYNEKMTFNTDRILQINEIKEDA
jgi:hypothetical protein